MTSAPQRWWTLADVVGFSVLVPAFIWYLRDAHPRSWYIFPVWLTVSFLFHRDTPARLGWRADNLGPAFRQAAVAFVILAILIVTVGLLAGSGRAIPANVLDRVWRYFAFCLLQQVALQSFLNNRLMALTPQRWLSSLLAGGIFASWHWPNPVLVPLTFAGGTLLSWLFARHRNVIPLAVFQALVGSLASLCLPVEWHRGMRVGPGYYGHP
jgi:hypothetical protein